MLSTPRPKGVGGGGSVEGTEAGSTGIKAFKSKTQSRAAERMDYEKEFRDLAEAYKEALKGALNRVVKDAIPDERILDQAAQDYLCESIEKGKRNLESKEFIESSTLYQMVQEDKSYYQDKAV
jgi:hypothetical protein